MSIPQYWNSIRRVLSHPSNQKSLLSTIFRVVWWKINQKFFHFPVLFPITKTKVCICEPDSSYGSLMVYTQYPEYEEMIFLKDYLRESDIMIDVGANIGGITLLASEKIKSGKIFCFEPTNKPLATLRRNINLNSLDKIVEIIPKAVSKSRGTASFVLNENSEINHLAHSKSTKNISVSTISLDEFLKIKKLQSIDLIKIDVEGAEHFVLEGAKKILIDQKVGVLIIELNAHSENYGFSKEDTIFLLEKYGYSVFLPLSNLTLLPISKFDVKNADTINVVAVSPKTEIYQRIQKYL